MSTEGAAAQRRSNLILAVLGDDAKPVAHALASNDPAVKLAAKVTQPTLDGAAFVNDLAGIVDDDRVVIAIGKDPDVSTIRDVALKYDRNCLTKLLPSRASVYPTLMANPGKNGGFWAQKFRGFGATKIVPCPNFRCASGDVATR
jgi:hypothetical protein